MQLAIEGRAVGEFVYSQEKRCYMPMHKLVNDNFVKILKQQKSQLASQNREALALINELTPNHVIRIYDATKKAQQRVGFIYAMDFEPKGDKTTVDLIIFECRITTTGQSPLLSRCSLTNFTAGKRIPKVI